jgi:hypothetical protein
MNITINTRTGYDLIFEADNVRVDVDIESREYEKDEHGKIVNLNPKRDIATEALKQFAGVLEDMIYYRKAEFDSSDLISLLFEKLPQDVAIKLAKELNDTY